MGKISSQVSKGLGVAIQEAEELLNSGAEAHKKRHRRTKAEIQAEKETKALESQDNSLFESLDIPKEEQEEVEDNRPEWEKRSAKDHDEFCEWELEKAKLKGLENPDFDFRDIYEKYQEIYFIRILRGTIQTKELKTLKIRTIYPRMLICNEGNLGCQCIGYHEKDLIFDTYKDAEATYKTINLRDEKDAEEPKSKRKSSKGIDEYNDDENNEFEAYMSSQEDSNDE